MTERPILVFGATGKTGSSTARHLLKEGMPVRCFAHKKDARSSALIAKGAEMQIGNMADYSDVRAAMTGVDRIYFVAPWTPDQLHIAMTVATSAADANIKHIVALTQWLSDPAHPAVATRESYLTDQVFDWIPGANITKINVGWFADNYMPPQLLAVISQLGLFPFPLGDGKTAPVSNEDIGRVAATILMDPEKHAGKSYRPTGPDLMSPEDITNTFSKILGKPVKYQDIPLKMFLKAIRYMGMHPHMQSQLRHYVHDYQHGSFERDAPNDVVLEITGHPAEKFEDIARRYFETNPLTKPTLANKLRAIKGFLTLATTPPLDLDKYDKEQFQPIIKRPRFAKALK